MQKKNKARTPWWLLAIVVLIIILLVNIPQTPHDYPKEYKDLIFEWSQHHEIDPNLVFAIIKNESKFGTNAKSPKGAQGLMQIMPATGQWIAQQLKMEPFEAEQLYDPDLNIRFGCWYLASLREEFSGNTYMVIAAYNAGRGTVNEWINAGIWNGEMISVDNIPYKETRNYLKAVWKSYLAYKAIGELQENKQ